MFQFPIFTGPFSYDHSWDWGPEPSTLGQKLKARRKAKNKRRKKRK